MKRKNVCSWETVNGNARAWFNIYQAKNGGIFLMLGNKGVELTHKQVLDLDIDVYDLIDFDYGEFKKHYQSGN